MTVLENKQTSNLEYEQCQQITNKVEQLKMRVKQLEWELLFNTYEPLRRKLEKETKIIDIYNEIKQLTNKY